MQWTDRDKRAGGNLKGLRDEGRLRATGAVNTMAYWRVLKNDQVQLLWENSSKGFKMAIAVIRSRLWAILHNGQRNCSIGEQRRGVFLCNKDFLSCNISSFIFRPFEGKFQVKCPLYPEGFSIQAWFVKKAFVEWLWLDNQVLNLESISFRGFFDDGQPPPPQIL